MYKTDKRIIVAIVGVILFIVAGTIINLLLSYSYIKVVNSSDKSAVINVVNSSGSENKMSFSLDAAKDKKIRVKRGEHTVVAFSDKGDLVSKYYVGSAFFKQQVVEVQFKNQVQSTYLGDSELSCSTYTAETKQVIYYQCPDAIGLSNRYSIKNTAGESREIERQVNQQDAYGIFPYASRAYMGGFLETHYNDDGSAYLDKINPGEAAIGEDGAAYRSFTTRSFITDSLITNTSDSNISSYGVLGKDKNVYIFKSLTDTAPRKVDISKNVTLDNNHGIKTAYTGDKVVIFNGAKELLADDSSQQSNANVAQLLITINTNDGAVTAVDIPSSYRIDDLSINEEGQIIISSHVGTQRTLSYVTSTGELTSLSDNSVGPDSCQIGKKIYFSDSQNRILEYNLANHSSSAIYGGNGKQLHNMSCIYGNLYFTLGEQGSSLKHYMLNIDQDITDYSQKRPESVFPILGDERNNIASADYLLNTISVVYFDFTTNDYGHTCALSVGENNKIKDYLKSKGIAIDRYSIQATYRCGSASM